MIDYCPFCGADLNNRDCCLDKKNNSNMIDTSIFIEAFDETALSSDCKLILDGAKKQVYVGYVSTVILGEIMKKLLRLKKESSYRYDSIYEGVMDYLMSFKILCIPEESIERYASLDIRGKEKCQDKLNLACAVHYELKMFIMKDKNFTVGKKVKPTAIAQITNKNNDERLKLLMKKISDKIGSS